MLPVDVIESVSFVKGGFGGPQGNFTSSHLALETSDTIADKRSVNASLNSFLAGASISSPVGRKGSLMVSGRMSPISLEYRAMKELSKGNIGDIDRFRAGVFDLFGKWIYPLKEKDKVSITTLGSLDRYSVITSDGSLKVFGWANVIGSAQYFHDIEKGALVFRASYNGYRNFQQQQLSYRGKEYDFSMKSILNEMSLSADGIFPLGQFLNLRSGVHFRLAVFTPAQARELIFKTTSGLVSTYLQGVFNTKHLEANGSVRINYFKSTNTAILMPDINMSAQWRISPFLAFEGTFDLMSQFYHTLEGLPLGWSMDVIVPASATLPAERLLQGYLGLVLSLGKSTLSAGLFAREMSLAKHKSVGKNL